LRSAESDARTALERHRVAQEQIAAEEERARAALADATRRLTQLGQDLAHAEQLRNDSEAAEARLVAEDSALAEADADFAARATEAETKLADAVDAVHVAEAEANRATEAAAEANARAQTVARQLGEAEQRWRRLDQQFAQVRTERDQISARAVDPAALEAASAEQAAAEGVLGSTPLLPRSRPAPRPVRRWLPPASDRPPPTRRTPSWRRRRMPSPKCWR
jgi:chromosome segregation protein